MRLLRYCWAAWLTVFMVFTTLVQAAPVPAYSGGMNNAVGSLMKFKVSKWGFAANDPRVLATTGAVGAGLTQVAVAVGTGAVATVGWPAVLAGAGIAAVVGGVVALVPALIDWLWGDGADKGKAKASGTGMGSGDPNSLPLMPATFPAILDAYGAGQDIYFKQADGKVRHVKTISVKCPSSSFCSVPSPYSGNMDYTFTTAYSGPFPGPNGYWSKAYSKTVGSANGSPYEYWLVFDFAPPTGVPITVPAYTPAMKPIADVIADIPPAVLAQPISDKMLADAANAAWKQAAANNPNVLPWSATDPITPADVSAWRTANPDNVPMPTVGDFISPVAPPGATSVPIPLPGSNPNTSPATPGQGTQIDLGPDPNTPPPQLEQTPTAAQILAPILGLMPDLKAFTVPGHTAECPRPTFAVWSKSYTVESHCDLLEANRSILEAAMLLVWTLASIVIVLRA